jgi:hypothetical protein
LVDHIEEEINNLRIQLMNIVMLFTYIRLKHYSRLQNNKNDKIRKNYTNWLFSNINKCFLPFNKYNLQQFLGMNFYI